MWSRLIGRPARPSAAPRPPALRCVVLDEGRGSPSVDYLLMPWLLRLGLETVFGEVRRAPGPGELRSGDLVVLSRYVPPTWRRALQKRHAELAGLVYFMDDDLLDPAALAGLPTDYARKLSALASSQRRWLERYAQAFWVSTPALATKYAALKPHLLPLAPTPSMVLPQPALRIAYHGTASHAAEIEWLHDVIAAVQARCEHTHVELFGEHAVHRRYRDLPRVSVLHPMRWVNYVAYTAAHPAHIGLAPLLPGAFNAARGAIKFYDYARMGATGLYTDVEPYRGFVHDGVDGLLLPNEPQRWVEAIAELAVVGNPRLGQLQAGVARRIAKITGG